MMAITVGATVVTLIPLFLVLGYLLTKGVASLNWAFFTRACPRPSARRAAAWPTRSSARSKSSVSRA